MKSIQNDKKIYREKTADEEIRKLQTLEMVFNLVCINLFFFLDHEVHISRKLSGR